MNKMLIGTIIWSSICILDSTLSAATVENLFPEEVVHNQVIRSEEKKELSKNDIESLKGAKETVKKYWLLPANRKYELLSRVYKEVLKDTYNILNADEYQKFSVIIHRVWRKQTYQHGSVKGRYVQISVLSEWSQEGYEGVMTFVFDLVNEDDTWKIANIVY